MQVIGSPKTSTEHFSCTIEAKWEGFKVELEYGCCSYASDRGGELEDVLKFMKEHDLEVGKIDYDFISEQNIGEDGTPSDDYYDCVAMTGAEVCNTGMGDFIEEAMVGIALKPSWYRHIDEAADYNYGNAEEPHDKAFICSSPLEAMGWIVARAKDEVKPEIIVFRGGFGYVFVDTSIFSSEELETIKSNVKWELVEY